MNEVFNVRVFAQQDLLQKSSRMLQCGNMSPLVSGSKGDQCPMKKVEIRIV